MNEVTIVCCYNNLKTYNDFVNTLKAQTCPCEIIGIDNRDNKAFTSCAGAYNSVKDQITTKYVIYSHQDILLTEPDTLAKFVSYLGRINADDILGVAGVKFNEPGLFSNIKHIDNLTGELIYPGNERVEGGMMECDTVDECFFGGYAEHFRRYPFDDVLCNNWHLYAAEACMRIKSNYPRGGGHNVYVCDVYLIHLSNGVYKGRRYTLSFYYGFYKLCRHYAKYFPFIRTTCVSSRTDFIHALLYYPHLRTREIMLKTLKAAGLYEILRSIKKKIIH